MNVVEAPRELDQEHLRNEIKREYATVAATPEKVSNFHVGRDHAIRLGYQELWLSHVPEEVLASFAGTGCPFQIGGLNSGASVVDLGSGGGMDSFIAAAQVGPKGRVTGVDMTDEMLAKSNQHKAAAGLAHVEFRKGYLENLPVDDASTDVVISNGVVNLCPDKTKVFAEIHRILKPGGKVQIADILVHKQVTDKMRDNIDLWTG